MPTMNPVERLRRIWTPEREVDELFSDLSPGTLLDSQIREIFSRLILGLGSLEIDITNPVPECNIRWEVIHTDPSDAARRKLSIWVEPA